MAANTGDRNMLFGALALQLGFVNSETVVAAMKAWLVDKSKSLGQVFVEQQALTAEDLAWLETAVEKHLAAHEHSVAKSLTAIRLGSPQYARLLDISSAEFETSGYETEAFHHGAVDAAAGQLAPDSGSPAPGRFQIVRPHARGGLGEVFVADDAELPREVALKRIQDRYADDPNCRARFVLEAQITGALEHPSIVPVYGLSADADGRPYYAMRFIRGDSLKDAIDRFHNPQADAAGNTTGLELRKLLQRFIAVCNAVEYAHSRGVLHRDLKPANVMLGKYGETLVVDWGLAKMSQSNAAEATSMTQLPQLAPSGSGDSAPTEMGTALGTPQFMSPEQAAGRLDLLGPASDVYSLGATLYSILTGRTPFEGGSVPEVLRKVQKGDYTAARQVNATVAAPLDAICRKAMALEPGDRYASARALADDLEHWLADEPVAAYPESRLQRLARWSRRHRTWTRAGAAAIVLVSVVALGAALLIRHSWQSEVRALRIAAATDHFHQGLKATDWSPEHLRAMDVLLAELSALDYEQLDELRGQVPQELSRAIARGIDAPSLAPADIARLEAQLALLDPRDEAAAEKLRGELGARRTHWDPFLELAAPFSSLPTVFGSTQVRIQDGSLAVTTTPGKQSSTLVKSRVAAGGSVRLQALFEPTWDRAAEVAVAIEGDKGSGYQFAARVVQPPKSKEVLTFRAARETGGNCALEIRRDSKVLQRVEISASQLAEGPLRLAIERQREKLSLAVNSLAPVEVLDPLPVVDRTARFAFRWPVAAGMRELRAWRQNQAERPSPLEEADRLYDGGRYTEALSKYQAFDAATVDPVVRQESRTKQALCFVALKRSDEAVPLLRQVIVEPGERWPPLAGFHLWILLEQQRREAEAEEVYKTIAGKYRFDQLALLIPENLRQTLMTAQLREFSNLSELYRPSPGRIQRMERAAAIDRLVSTDGQGTSAVQFKLLRAYMFANMNEAALPLAKTVLAREPQPGHVRNYGRLLRWTGKPAQALHVIGDFQSKHGKPTHLILERARAHAALNDWDAVEADAVEGYHLGITDVQVPIDAALVYGVLLERRGQLAEARRLYGEAFDKTWPEVKTLPPDNTSAIRCMIAGSWSGRLTESEALQRFDLMVGNVAGSAAGSGIRAGIGSELIGKALVHMWRSPQGHKTAEEAYIFETVPLGDRARRLALLAGTALVREGAFPQGLSNEQDQLVSDIATAVYDASFVRAELEMIQATQATLAWNGTVGSLGWAGLSPRLEPSLRAPLAYILGHRLLTLRKTDDAKALLEQAAADAVKASALARLAGADLELLGGNQGLLTITSTSPRPARLLLDRSGQEASVLTVQRRLEKRLPVGSYRIKLVGDEPDVEISSQSIEIATAGRSTLDISWKWTPSAGEPSGFGLIPQPASLPGAARWQAITLAPSGVVDVAFSRDGRRIACTDNSNIVRIYDAATFDLVGVIASDLPLRCASLAWGPEGRLACAWSDRTLRVYGQDTTIEWTGSAKAGLRAASWSPDGRWLAAGADAGTVYLWPSEGGQPRVVAGHEEEVNSISWRPDSRQFASVSDDIRLWNVDGSPAGRFPLSGPRSRSLSWSASGRWIAAVASGDSNIRLLDVGSGKLKKIPFPSAGIYRAAWSPKEDVLACGYQGAVSFLRADGAVIKTVKGAMNTASAIAWSPQGKLVCGSTYGRLLLWDADHKQEAVLSSAGPVNVVGWNAGGHYLAAATMLDATVRLRDDGGQAARTYQLGSSPWFDWHPQRDRLAIGAGSAIRLADVDKEPEPKLAGFHGNVKRFAWSVDGRYLGASSSRPALFAFDTHGGPVRVLSTGDKQAEWLAWSSTEALLACNRTGEGNLLTWNGGFAPGPTWNLGRSSLVQIAWSPDRSLLASIGDGPAIYLHLPGGKVHQKLTGKANQHRIVWSPDGKRLAAISGDHLCSVWNIQSGAVERVIRQATDQSLAWHPKQSLLAIGGRDGAVRVYDPFTGQPQSVVAILPEHQSCVFGPGGDIRHASADIDRHLAYVVQRPDRSWEVLTPADFRQRTSQASSTVVGQKPAAPAVKVSSGSPATGQ